MSVRSVMQITTAIADLTMHVKSDHRPGTGVIPGAMIHGHVPCTDCQWPGGLFVPRIATLTPMIFPCFVILARVGLGPGAP